MSELSCKYSLKLSRLFSVMISELLYVLTQLFSFFFLLNSIDNQKTKDFYFDSHHHTGFRL